MSDPKNKIREILKKAYQIEVDGYTFYSMTADQADKTAVQELFDKLARDETEHKAFLRDIMRGHEAKGAAAFNVDRRDSGLKAFTATIFTDKFKKQAEGAAFEMGALSVGMQLESNAIQYFSEAAKTAGEAEIRDFYTFLAGWEKEHFDALQKLFDVIKGDFWHQSGFEPF
jgi:rubrerythrin